MKQNSVLRKSAKAALSGHWTSAVLFVLVFVVLYLLAEIPSFASQGFLESAKDTGNTEMMLLLLLLVMLGMAFSILLIPVAWSYNVAFLSHLRENNSFALSALFRGYPDFLRIFATNLVMTVYILFWLLLFIVPAFVKAYSYAMVNFILLDDPQIEGNAAINRSKKMMDGHKWQLFKLDIPFILLVLLGTLTLGIAWLWILPWWNTSRAAFYEELRLENEMQPAAATEDIQ